MLVMPACSTGWFWHCLARETGRIGHLYSPGTQRGPWPWFPYALDNGAFSCWDMGSNTFDHAKWSRTEPEWLRLVFWATAAPIKPMWAIVPDVVGNARATIERWAQFAPVVERSGIPAAVAVQDGMTPADVKRLDPAPTVVCVGGTTAWKWNTAATWCEAFQRVHVLRCNSPARLSELEAMGVESTDGTGWNRGDKVQTAGLEAWARSNPTPRHDFLWPFTCKQTRQPKQTCFA